MGVSCLFRTRRRKCTCARACERACASGTVKICRVNINMNTNVDGNITIDELHSILYNMPKCKYKDNIIRVI